MERLQYSLRDIETESIHIRIGLERPEQTFGFPNTRSCILEPDADAIMIFQHSNYQLFFGGRLHGSQAVLGYVEEDLKQTIAVRPHQWQAFGNIPLQRHACFRKGCLDQDS